MTATAIQFQDSEEQQQINFLNDVVAKQKTAYSAAPYPSIDQRRSDLDKLSTALRKYKDELALAVNTDFSSRSTAETMIAEIMVTLECIKYNRKNLRKWM
ncbi:MAG: coniferyl-aldehyde dehydrogenase, partial [Bermanella sp.]